MECYSLSWGRTPWSCYESSLESAVLLRNHIHGYRNSLRRIAGVRVAGLIAQQPLQQILSGWRRQVGVQDEVSGINTELLLRIKGEGIVDARGKIDSGHNQP